MGPVRGALLGRKEWVSGFDSAANDVKISDSGVLILIRR